MNGAENDIGQLANIFLGQMKDDNKIPTPTPSPVLCLSLLLLCPSIKRENECPKWNLSNLWQPMSFLDPPSPPCLECIRLHFEKNPAKEDKTQPNPGRQNRR